MTAVARNIEIKGLALIGLSDAEIGRRFHITRQRVHQILHPAPKRSYLIASHNYRKTCFICQKRLEIARKFCVECVKRNKLNTGGRDINRGIVRGRDANTCQVCGYEWDGLAHKTKRKRLDVHHLEGLCGELSLAYDRPEMMDKLITVCHKCHYNLHDHRKYGKDSS